MDTHDSGKTVWSLARVRARFHKLVQRWQAASLTLLQLFLHFVPSERRHVFVLTLLIGALCGLAAVAFHLTIRFLEPHLIDQALAAPAPYWMILTLLMPTLGGLIGGALLYYVVPDARRNGVLLQQWRRGRDLRTRAVHQWDARRRGRVPRRGAVPA